MHVQLSGGKFLKVYFPIPGIDEHNTVLFKLGSKNIENKNVPTWADVVESVSRIGIVEEQISKWPVNVTSEKLSEKEIRVRLEGSQPGSTFKTAHMDVKLQSGGFSVDCSKEINFEYIQTRDYLGFIKKGIGQLVAAGELVIPIN